MLSRSFHIIRSFFTAQFDPTLISPLEAVYFNNLIASIPKEDSPDANKIIYNSSTRKFRIPTTSATQNNLLISWGICLNTCNSPPIFAIQVEDENGQVFGTFPHSGIQSTVTLAHTFLLQLPTPQTGRVYYYLSLINMSGCNCYYSLQVIDTASMLIVSMDEH